MTREGKAYNTVADTAHLACVAGEELTGADIARLRRHLVMSQTEFAAAYRIPLGTLQNWEHGRRKPDAGSQTLLLLILLAPKVIARILRRQRDA